MRRHSTTRWGVLVLLAGLVTTACGGPEPDEPTPEPTETVPVTATPTPEETEPAPRPAPWPEPVRPGAMDTDDAEGAQAAAEYFLELYPYVFATGDLTTWEAMSHPDCQFCTSVNDRVEELHRDGGYGSGGEITVQEFRVLPPDDEFPHYRVGVQAEEEPSVSHSASGDVLDSAAGGQVRYTLGVVHDGAWVIRGMAIEGAP